MRWRTVCVRLSLVVAALAVAGGVLTPSALAEQAGTTIYVSPSGDDGHPGTSPERPLRTPAAAKQRLRSMREQGAEGPFSVVFGDGVYWLDRTLTFTPADGGTAEQPVVWRAAGDARPVVSGGRSLSGWQAPSEDDDDPIWTFEIDAVAEGAWYFHQLWINGERATRARVPNEGYLYTAGPLPGFENPREHRGERAAAMGFRYRGEDLQQWDNLDDVNIFVYHAWTASLHWLEELDTEANEARFVNPSVWPIGWWDTHRQRYHVENFLEALDAPGQWYLDRDTGVLHYWPREGEDLTEAEVVAPQLRQIVQVAGDGEAGDPVRGLHFEGVAFHHADWEISDRGRGDRDTQTWFVSADGQSANFATAAVRVTEAEHVSFKRCEVAHVGEHGLWLGRGTQHSKVQQTRVHDVGAGAVRIGENDPPHHDWQKVTHNVIDNCFLHDGGNVFPAGCGILLQRASHNEITHNEISDFYYTGISLGWSWSYQDNPTHHNVVRYNHVHHLGWGVLSDMGGIYTLGVSPGTEVTHNVFHSINSYDYGGWGLYTDEGSSDILMAHNLVYHTRTGGFHQHYGRDNVVRNNILAFSAEHQIQRSRDDEQHNSFDFERNIVVFDNANLLGGRWANDLFAMRENLYWDLSGEPLDFDGQSFEQWQQRGHDAGSIVADPRFAAGDFADRAPHELAVDDFRLAEDSPAIELGFEPLELDRVGLYGDEDWVRLPETIDRPTMTIEPRPRVTELVDDFEDLLPGMPPGGARVVGVGDGASIAVSDKTSAGGRHSLQFVDAPDLTERWHPHLYYTLDVRQGRVTARFDLRIEEEAEFAIEWRDAAAPYRTGPRIVVRPDGTLLGPQGQALLDLPHGAWVGIEMTATLGLDSDGTWDLTVTLPDEPPRQFADLPLRNEDFRHLRWFGVSSLADEAAVFYLDNLDLRPAAGQD